MLVKHKDLLTKLQIYFKKESFQEQLKHLFIETNNIGKIFKIKEIVIKVFDYKLQLIILGLIQKKMMQ